MIISHVSLGVIAKIHEIVCTVQRIKKKRRNDVALYIKSHNEDGSCIQSSNWGIE